MIGWNFPSNGGGQINGVADAGIQTFTGKEISSLVREICQNSLDAAIDENSSVTVEFQLHEIDTKKICGCSIYKSTLNKCREFWKDKAMAQKFFDKAIEQINQPRTFVMRISDYNTTGLAEPYNPRAQDGWNALTKIDGGATKTGDAAGSFGIGKNAPFANSFYRLVVYRTLNLKGERAAQGMSRLVSFYLEAEDIAAGVGYYGEQEKNLPVENISNLKEISERTAVGTDIFIYGFNGKKDWMDKIITELVENFLVAIYRNKLHVKVQDLNREIININKNSLSELLSNYDDKAHKFSNYYKILSDNVVVRFFERDFHGMDKLKLRVLIVRKSGMKLFEQDHISSTLSFTGILELEGRELNEFFREMETPSHDKWEPTRYEKDSKLAKEYLTELKRWVRDTISNIGMENIADEVNVEGLNHMLDFDDSAVDGDYKKAESFDKPSKFEIELIPVATRERNISTNGGNNNLQTRRAKGDLTDNENDSNAIRKLGGSRKRKSSAIHSGKENPDGQNIILEPNENVVACSKIRVIRVDNKKYRLILKTSRDISEGRIEISAVGENNINEKLFIMSATSADSNSEVQGMADIIALKNLRAEVEAKISFELRDERNYALGVAVYEN